MNIYSNIGFKVESVEDLMSLIRQASDNIKHIEASNGSYHVYSDESGAELWIQLSKDNEYVGINPHFRGRSKMSACLTAAVDRPLRVMDGAFYAWTTPTKEKGIPGGAHPFIFDLPDYRTTGKIEFPSNVEIQLTAFAQELRYFDSEQEFFGSQNSELKFDSRSFIPAEILTLNTDDKTSRNPAIGLIAGFIKDWEIRKNSMTGNVFYSLLVDTLGGEIDVVAGTGFFEQEPKVNGIIQGKFWLSGRII